MIIPTSTIVTHIATTLTSVANSIIDTPSPTPPTGNTGRAPGDTRSAEQITSGPLFSIFQEHQFRSLIGGFYNQIGGHWNDPKSSADAQADRAADAERVLAYIDQMGGHGSFAGDGQIQGYRSPGWLAVMPTILRNTTPGSEAGKLLNFANEGYPSLRPGFQTQPIIESYTRREDGTFIPNWVKP